MTSTIYLCSALFIVFQLASSHPLLNHTVTSPEYLRKLYSSGQYNEFGKLLHIENPSLVRPLQDAEDPVYTKELQFGDILLAPWQLEKIKKSDRNALHYSHLKWDGYIIPYVLITDGYTLEDISEILTSIYTWNQRVRNVIFKRRTDEKDYVVIFNGNGCYAHLGRIMGQQSLSLSSKRCMRRGTILHEMAHTVGLVHEHIRPDRDDYIRILDGNIPDDWKSQYEKTDYEGWENLGKYDYYSVMHYRLRAPETGQPAFKVLQNGIDVAGIGQRDDLTQTDITKIRKLYD